MYAFNDCRGDGVRRADRIGDIRALIDDRERWLDGAGRGGRWRAAAGCRHRRLTLLWRRAKHDQAPLAPAPRPIIVNHFGGSHAQRDALQRTLLESALRSGRYELARALTAERLGLRESSVYGWNQRARALRGLGDDIAATEAEKRAARYRAQFAEAITN